MGARLKTEFWIHAQLRLCAEMSLPIVVVRRGDRDAGQVLVKLYRPGWGCALLARRFDEDGARAWMVVAGGAGIDAERACDAYIAREVDIDTDVWVIEIEDRKGVYRPDGQNPGQNPGTAWK